MNRLGGGEIAMDRIFERLADIVGSDYVSNAAEERFIYSRDPGVQEPHEPDYVVLPNTTEKSRRSFSLQTRKRYLLYPWEGAWFCPASAYL